MEWQKPAMEKIPDTICGDVKHYLINYNVVAPPIICEKPCGSRANYAITPTYCSIFLVNSQESEPFRGPELDTKSHNQLIYIIIISKRPTATASVAETQRFFYPEGMQSLALTLVDGRHPRSG